MESEDAQSNLQQVKQLNNLPELGPLKLYCLYKYEECSQEEPDLLRQLSNFRCAKNGCQKFNGGCAYLRT